MATAGASMSEEGRSWLVSGRRPGKPPLHPWILRLAILSTLAAGSALGVWNLVLIDTALGVVPAGWVQLHAHLQLWSFAALLVVGVSSFVVPRFWEAPPPRAWAIRGAAAAIAIGVALLAVGLLLGPGRLSGLLLPMSGALELAGAGLFAATVTGLYRRRRRGRPGLDRYLLAGTGWLVIGSAFQCWNTAATAAAGRAELAARFTEPAYLAMLGGFTGSWIIGVGLRVVVGPDAARAGRWFFVWQAGVASGVTAVLAPSGGRLAAGLQILSWIALGSASLAIAAEPGLLRRRFPAVELIGERRKERIQRSAWASLALHGALLLAAAVMLSVGRTPHAFWLDAARHTFTLGFLAMMALAMGSLIFPRLGGGSGERPRLLELGWALLGAGVLARLLQCLAAMGWPQVLPWVALSGALSLAGLVFGLGGLLPTLRGIGGSGETHAL